MTPTKVYVNFRLQLYIFRKATQNLDTYHPRLRMLGKNCEFADIDMEIKAQLIQSCTSCRLRRRALRQPDMTLTTLLDHGRSLELSEIQATGIFPAKTTQVQPTCTLPHLKESRKGVTVTGDSDTDHQLDLWLDIILLFILNI